MTQDIVDDMLQGQFGGRLNDRKARLLLCACVRVGLWDLLEDPRSQAAVEVAERFADGQASWAELNAASTAAAAVTVDSPRIHSPIAFSRMRGACCAAWATTWSLPAALSAVARYYFDAEGRSAWSTMSLRGNEPASQSAPLPSCRVLVPRLLAELAGPEPSPAVDPGWLAFNGGVLPAFAQAIYDDRRFSDLPILADALEDAGCTDARLLTHCRQPGEHVRGCWLVDLLLGKP
jgi:hypothetical protein